MMVSFPVTREQTRGVVGWDREWPTEEHRSELEETPRGLVKVTSRTGGQHPTWTRML